ncbi:hypothetical protein ERO13_D09G156000v2 [Gossypium hirsutum]|uniref:Protein MODIFIER OF SNC1 11 n=2 Tax=Gossypium TaxID=3633 RepID=A0ABM3APZ2_GOSHI|nr:protein MODIFIER OF SNC1 11 [Gossypium hirsutum]KAG4130616.1 hypothetical protein ERO13_D09G156000v2 [Gossypium hirsutum]TYH54691.1 hypothetical protein ES332_D09G187200v1 [Gossypium tomentosum]
MATTTTTTTAAYSSAEENPKNTLDAASPSMDKSDPPSASTLSDAEVSVKEGEGLKTTGTAVGLAAGESSGPADDIQKKIRRAERFGVPIQLSEQEKRNSRAERFGTAPSSKGSEESKQSEELKRKAREQRGLGLLHPLQQLMRMQRRKLVLLDLHHIRNLIQLKKKKENYGLSGFRILLLLLYLR